MEKIIVAHITAEFVQKVPGGPWVLRFEAVGEGHPWGARAMYIAEVPAIEIAAAVKEPVIA